MNFRYCPNCKTEIKLTNRLLDCKACGFHFYLSPSPTNGVILLNEKDEILLVRRKIEPKKGFWDFPGGFIEFGESIEVSVKREIKEELGINLKNIKYFISIPDIYTYKGYIYNTICSIFVAKIDNEKLNPADDISAVMAFKKNKIPFDRIAFKGVEKALKKYLSSSY